MAGDPGSIVAGLKSHGVGITVGFVFPVTPNGSASGRDPKRAELERTRDQALTGGALGLKILGGHYPLSAEATALTIKISSEARCWCAAHAGSVNAGSDITGLEELLELADGLPIHVAHINSYCRGQHTGNPIEEAARALAALARAPNARSESYLATINGAHAGIEDGVPKSNVVKTCLKLGGFPATADGMRNAILAGWARIHGLQDGETVLLSPADGLAHYTASGTDVGVSFAVNPPGSAISIALAKAKGEFIVTAISTDGGAIPRNTTIEQGLALVEFGALTIDDFVRKTCLNAGRMLGLKNKGHLTPGADADIAIVDPVARKAVSAFANGNIIMQEGSIVGSGGVLATTPRGVAYLRSEEIECVIAAPDWI
jgi:hypothetical protein